MRMPLSPINNPPDPSEKAIDPEFWRGLSRSVGFSTQISYRLSYSVDGLLMRLQSGAQKQGRTGDNPGVSPLKGGSAVKLK